MELDVRIEALLFYKAAPLKRKQVLQFLDVSEEEFSAALERLISRLKHGALRLLLTETDIQLVTAPELSSFIESLRKQEVTTDIGKAGAETLAIILYREPVSRADIDRIRGVNSSFILRNLMTRGLVTRESVTGQGYQFRPSTELLQHLGVSTKQDLPRFAEFLNLIEQFEVTPQPS